MFSHGKLIIVIIITTILVMPTYTQEYSGIDPSGQTITFWYQHSGRREAALQEIINEFNATNEYGITVEGIYQGGYGDIFNQMLTVLGTPNVPNLVVAYQNQAASYQLQDGLVDMNLMVNDSTWGLTEDDRSDFFRSFFEADVFPTFDGARLGFPPNRSAEVMYYNVDWLAELQANGHISFDGPPQTPAQFEEAACAANRYPFSAATGNTDLSTGYELSFDASRFASWTYAFGGDIFDTESGEYTYNSDAAIEAMTFLQTLFAEDCARGVTEREGDMANFGAGTTLFTVGSSTDISAYDSITAEGAGHSWSIASLPHTTAEPVVNVYGASVSIPKSTPEKELAAWLFLEYYTSTEVQARWAVASSYFPVRASVAENLSDYFEANEAYALGFELLQYGQFEPPVPGYDFVRDLIEQQMIAIVENGAPVQETLDAANEEANAILSDEMAQLN